MPRLMDEAESCKETAAIARLEAFMLRFLTSSLSDQGVHYSDLFEQYLPVPDKPHRLLKSGCPNISSKSPKASGVPRRTTRNGSRKPPCVGSSALPKPCWKASIWRSGIASPTPPPPLTGCVNAAGPACTSWAGPSTKKAALISSRWARSPRWRRRKNSPSGVRGNLRKLCDTIRFTICNYSP